MNLTVRSSDGLKRANTETFGRLKALPAVGNVIPFVLDRKSAKEIKQLLPYEKVWYWRETLDA